MRTNPYASPLNSIDPGAKTQSDNTKRFRWQIVPATFTYILAFVQTAFAALMIFSCVEWLQRSQSNQSRTVLWYILEMSIIPIWSVASVLAFASAWSWTRQHAMKAISLLLLSAFVFSFGLIARM